MGESIHHADLVEGMVKWVRVQHSANTGLSLLVDSVTTLPGRRPPRIGGFTPDLFVRTVPSSFVIVGEAKTYADFLERRPATQITAFLIYLRSQAAPTFVMATPLAIAGAARTLVKRLQRETDSRNVKTVFIHGR